MRGRIRFVSLFEQKCQSIVDESEIEEEAVASQTVSTVADELDTTLWVITIQSSQNFVVGKTVALLNYNVFGCPCPLDDVVVLKRDSSVKWPNTPQLCLQITREKRDKPHCH